MYIFLFGFYSDQNPAEKMFAEMKEKDGLTYSAMIIGLVKVCVVTLCVSAIACGAKHHHGNLK